MRLYVASSWRNIYQPIVVALARAIGWSVYDFRHPKEGNKGFSWREVGGKDWKKTRIEDVRKLLNHPIADEGFALDMNALREADACVFVAPAGVSASLEMGYAVGAGKYTAWLYPTDLYFPPRDAALLVREIPGHSLDESWCPTCSERVQECHRPGDDDGCRLPGKLRRDFEPELMVKMCDRVLIGERELIAWLHEPTNIPGPPWEELAVT